VTAFEVLEHSPTPIATMKQALSMLEYKGRLLFSTLLMDQVPRYATDHWYIAPRNGHISLHTRLSLGNMFSQLGWQVRSFDENLYLAERYPSSLPE
jgi:2-polyprenyl-3-methyl-5-hydroxy-6-metoxy-1,4-benzoquinol methylase